MLYDSLAETESDLVSPLVINISVEDLKVCHAFLSVASLVATVEHMRQEPSTPFLRHARPQR